MCGSVLFRLPNKSIPVGTDVRLFVAISDCKSKCVALSFLHNEKKHISTRGVTKPIIMFIRENCSGPLFFIQTLQTTLPRVFKMSWIDCCT